MYYPIPSAICRIRVGPHGAVSLSCHPDVLTQTPAPGNGCDRALSLQIDVLVAPRDGPPPDRPCGPESDVQPGERMKSLHAHRCEIFSHHRSLN
eukprot:COSAG01_NODE_92_length_27199_cov_100.594649_26_plen_94_part_00